MSNRPKIKDVLLFIAVMGGVLSLCAQTAALVQVDYSTVGVSFISGRGGEPKIVLGRDATYPEETGAAELAEYLKKSTGSEFAIIREGQEDGGENLIYVGDTEFARRSGIEADLLGREQWFIRTSGSALILAGGRPRGALYAVYRFLEDIVGVRWWNPWEEFVPALNTLETGEIDVSGEPVYRMRNLNTLGRYDCASGSQAGFAPRNRVNIEMQGSIPWEYGGDISWGPPYFVHTEGQYFRLFAQRGDFKRNPEWVALKDGKREIHDRFILNQLCLSNEGLREAFLSELRNNIEKTRGQDSPPVIFDVSLNDVPSVCECPGCKAKVRKFGNDTGLLLDFVNYMAAGIEEDYPDILISTLAYLNTEHVPEGIVPRPNVMIVLCDTRSTYTEPISEDGYFADRLKEWSIVSDKLYIWDYHTNFRDLALPMPFESTFQPDIQLFRRYNAVGLMTEYHNPIFEDMRDLRLWMLAKLMEDPYRDKNRLVSDFTEGFYGPAGVFIREYLFALQEAATENPSYVTTAGRMSSLRYLTPDFVVAVQLIFERAEKAVADSEKFLRRVRHARMSIDKASLAIFPRIWQQYMQTGEDIPFCRGEIAARLKDTVESQWRLRTPGTGQWRSSYRKRRAEEQKEAFLASIHGYLEQKLIVVGPPEKFAHKPEEEYMDYRADSIVPYQPAELVEDDSETGIAVRRIYGKNPASERGGPGTEYLLGEDYVLSWDLHDYTSPASGDEPTISYLKSEDVPGPGYNWYKLGTYRLTDNSFLWIYNIGVEVNLRNAIDPLHPAAEYDIWANIKFEGPSFPHGKRDDINAVFVERVVVLRAE